MKYLRQAIFLLLSSVMLIGCESDIVEEEPETEQTEIEQESDPVSELDEKENEEVNSEEVDEGVETAEPVIHVETYELGGEVYELQLTLHPIEREGEYALVTMEAEMLSAGQYSKLFANILGYPLSEVGGSGGFKSIGLQLRLFDTVNDTVGHALFYQEEGEIFTETYPLVSLDSEYPLNRMNLDDEEPIVYQAIYNAPVEDSIHVLIGNVGLILDVPVIDKDGVVDIAEVFMEENLPETVSVTLEDLPHQVYHLQSYTENLVTSIGILTEAEQAMMTLESDILFDFDSSDLHAEANTVIQYALDELTQSDGGELLIVGHTDNEGSEAYNQVLSEDRAESVLQRLEELGDLSHFETIVTEGRAFHEPIASNSNEEGRSYNRRVEIHYTPATEYVLEEKEIAGLEDSLGPTMEYVPGEVLKVEYDGSYENGISIDSLRRKDGYIIGTIRLHKLTPNRPIELLVSTGSIYGPRRIPGYDEDRQVGSSQHDADGITLISGDQRIFPIDYYALSARHNWDIGQKELFPLTDRAVNYFFSNQEEGETLTVTVIWPDVPGDTVTLDAGPSDEFDRGERYINSSSGTATWRMENVPIEEWDES